MKQEPPKHLSTLPAEDIGERLDTPVGDWPWKRQMIIGRVNGGQKHKTGLKPHVVFNDVAVALYPSDNRYLQLLEKNSDGIDFDFVYTTLRLNSRDAAKTLMCRFRLRMKNAFGQDLLIGSGGVSGHYLPHTKPIQNIRYRRPHELKPTS